MLYATYDYYQNIYCGTMTEDEFRRHIRSASAYLDQITFGRVGALAEGDPLQSRVADACCAVAEASLLNQRGGNVVSESNDGISKTYAGVGQKTDMQRMYESAALYLSGTGLLYRGVY